MKKVKISKSHKCRSTAGEVGRVVDSGISLLSIICTRRYWMCNHKLGLERCFSSKQSVFLRNYWEE